MNRSTLKFVLVAFLLLVVLPLNTFGAEIFRSKGKAVSSIFFSQEGCISQTVIVFFGKFNNGDTQPPPKNFTAIVEILRSDLCTGLQIFNANGAKELTVENFQIAKDFSSASLNVSMELLEVLSDVPLTVNVAIDWIAISDLFRGSGHFVSRHGGTTIINRFHGLERNVDGTGVVTDGVTDFIAGSEDFSSIFSSNDAGILIEK